MNHASFISKSTTEDEKNRSSIHYEQDKYKTNEKIEWLTKKKAEILEQKTSRPPLPEQEIKNAFIKIKLDISNLKNIHMPLKFNLKKNSIQDTIDLIILKIKELFIETSQTSDLEAIEKTKGTLFIEIDEAIAEVKLTRSNFSPTAESEKIRLLNEIIIKLTAAKEVIKTR